MNARDSVLVALPAVLVGAGLGYFFASLGEGPRGRSEASARSVAADPRVPPREARTELVAPSTQAARVAAEPVTVEVSPRVGAAELERALESIAAPKQSTPAGTGGIRGKVTDETGAPLAGAVVIADAHRIESTLEPAEVGAAAPAEEELEEFLREQARSWAEGRAGRRRSLSAADGTFLLTNLDPVGSYGLSAFLEGYVVAADGAYAVSPGSAVHFRARRVHVIPIELVFENGAPASEGVVGVTRGDHEQLFAWSAAERELRIPAGLVGLRGYAGVRQGGFRRQGVDSDAASEEVALDVVANNAAPVRLVLKRRCGIRGLVIDEFGGGGGTTVVRLLPIPAGSELDERALASSDRRSWQLGSRFEFLDLSPGTYAVGLSNWEEALLAHAVTTVSSGVSEVDLVVPEPDPASHLVVRAFGPGGSPLEDLEFRWKHRRDGGSSSGGIRGRRGPDGAYWLLPKAEFFGKWPSGTYFSLTIEHAQLGAREFELEEGQREVAVTFEEPVSLVVVVGGYLGSGYESRLEVSLKRKEEGGSQRMRGRSFNFDGREGLSAEGVARYDNLAPGTWEVELNIRSDSHRSQLVHSREVRALSGETRVEVSLPELYELTVLAPELPVGTRVALMAIVDPEQGMIRGLNANASTEDDQRASFDGLVAGRYRLWASGAEAMEVEIPSAEIVLEAKREN